jgi:hypothetical protein
MESAAVREGIGGGDEKQALWAALMKGSGATVSAATVILR